MSGKPVVTGAMDKEIIRRVIRQHRNEIRYCYEKQLQRDPTLEGGVRVKFVIGRSGAVASAQIAGSTLGSAEVESCMTKKVRRWLFPKPKGGGVVVVTYPFSFSTKKKGLTIESGPEEGVSEVGLADRSPSQEKRKKVSTKVVPGRPVVKGSLDKEIIRRVVRQHRNEIRYCYEKQLQKEPALSGVLKVKFVIAKTGSVMSAVVSESTVGDDAVGECVTRKVRRWVFPEPKGGGIVVVNYPFVLSSSSTQKIKDMTREPGPDHALGNLQGGDDGATHGFGGLGLTTSGRGGDVVYGGEEPEVKRKTSTPMIVQGRPTVKGSLDKEIIRRVVRQHRNEIRYCYEKQLQRSPDLAGKVSVSFTIAGDGKVTSATVSSSTLKSAEVESCVTKKMRRWVFPEPKGGGVVVVKYPFLFGSK